jgi:hypothetical protein
VSSVQREVRLQRPEVLWRNGVWQSLVSDYAFESKGQVIAQLYHHPIPNSPYAHPGRDWELDVDGHRGGALWARAAHAISWRRAESGSAKRPVQCLNGGRESHGPSSCGRG